MLCARPSAPPHPSLRWDVYEAIVSHSPHFPSTPTYGGGTSEEREREVERGRRERGWRERVSEGGRERERETAKERRKTVTKITRQKEGDVSM